MRSQQEVTKEAVKIRFGADVMAALRASVLAPTDGKHASMMRCAASVALDGKIPPV